MAMALRSATRSFARAIGGTQPSVMQRFQPGLSGLVMNRTIITSEKLTRDQVVARVTNLHDTVLATNWADYLTLVYDVPFWEEEWDKANSFAGPYLSDPEIGAMMMDLNTMFDCFYACEDVRDHMNELLELATRASGLMGTGYNAIPKVENMDEHAQKAAQQYEILLEKYPAYKPKIEQTVGHGLALLRMKHKFKFVSMHRYFF